MCAVRDVINHYGLAVEEEILAGQEVLIIGPRGFRESSAGCRAAGALMRFSTFECATILGGPIDCVRHAELRHFRISAGVVGMDVRVDDPTNRPVG